MHRHLPRRITACCGGLRRWRGFTLLELMVVILVLAVLVGLAYPAYNRQVIKARRADGKAMLYEVAQRQQQFFTANNTFASSAADLGLGGNSPDGYYTLAISNFSATTYTLTASRVAPQTADIWCGDLTLTHLGAKDVTGSMTASQCW